MAGAERQRRHRKKQSNISGNGTRKIPSSWEEQANAAGIRVVPAGEAPTLKANETLFLDRLILPTSLEQLSIDQISAINRFREASIDHDAQFLHREISKNVLVNFVIDSRAGSVIEFGPGKFPLYKELNINDYAAVEIDPDAIAFCRKKGILVGSPSDVEFMSHLGDADAVVALFCFHFAINQQEFEVMLRCVNRGGYVLYNAIEQDSDPMKETIASRLSQMGVKCVALRGPPLARREAMYVAARTGVEELGAHLERLVRASVQIPADTASRDPGPRSSAAAG